MNIGSYCIIISDYKLLDEGSNYKVYNNESSYLFEIKDTLLISAGTKFPEYISSKFREIFPYR